jgi:hypothetical protein
MKFLQDFLVKNYKENICQINMLEFLCYLDSRLLTLWQDYDQNLDLFYLRKMSAEVSNVAHGPLAEINVLKSKEIFFYLVLVMTFKINRRTPRGQK